MYSMDSLINEDSLAVSYLFRSLGGVIGVSLGNTIEQQILRWNLEHSLTGENIEEVS